jgi:hypothetical protein
MYVDYNMGEVLLMACAFSSLIGSVGGGFFLYKQEQENTRIEELITNATSVLTFTECDYKGGGGTGIDDDAEVQSSSGFKSIIIPKGFSVDTYPEKDFTGPKITLGGPSSQKCTTIKSMKITKVSV